MDWKVKISKTTLIREHEDGSKLTLEFEGTSLDDMLSSYEEFLRGCGFVIDVGKYLEFIDDHSIFQTQDDEPNEALKKAAKRYKKGKKK